MYTYSMIHTPHENRQQRLIGTEQLNLLSLHSNMFLFQLAESTLYYAHSYSELLRQMNNNRAWIVSVECQVLEIGTKCDGSQVVRTN